MVGVTGVSDCFASIGKLEKESVHQTYPGLKLARSFFHLGKKQILANALAYSQDVMSKILWFIEV